MDFVGRFMGSPAGRPFRWWNYGKLSNESLSHEGEASERMLQRSHTNWYEGVFRQEITTTYRLNSGNFEVRKTVRTIPDVNRYSVSSKNIDD